jgi:hypothetical protein
MAAADRGLMMGPMSAAAPLAYVASAVLIVWGSAHVINTAPVADTFGDLSRDNRRIFVMEWIAEGLTHISLGTLVILITAIEGASNPATDLVYRIIAAIALAIAALTTATGARTPAIWFRICPVLLTLVASALVAASLV